MANTLGRLMLEEHPCEKSDELYQTIVASIKKRSGVDAAQGRVIVLFEKKKRKKTGKKR